MTARRRRLVPVLVTTLAMLAAAGLAAVGDPPGRPAVAGGGAVVADRPWLAADQPDEQRIDRLLAAMTLAEKVRLMYGVAAPPASGPAGYVPGVERLGIPPLVLSDGPLGLRDSARSPTRRPATALPAGVALAASFDRDLARAYGDVLGREARARGVHVLYGPAVNIARHPLGGRNFEYLGEDPYLTGELAVPYVRAVQRHRVAAQPKHYALNNQEHGRHTLSSNADERTIREIYLPGFQAAVQRGDAWSLMCANNPVNGVYSCEHPRLLRDILHREWGFDGVVGSDYSATHSAVRSVEAGLDQSFHWRDWGRYYRDLPELVRRGEVAESTIDERVRRVLRMMLRIGLLDAGRPAAGEVDLTAHARVAHRAAVEGTVLLRNERGVLPLDPARIRSVAGIGPYATAAHPGGEGSSRVLPHRVTPPARGIAARLAGRARVRTDDGADPDRAAALAARSDAAVVVVGDVDGEGRDRSAMRLPDGQDLLVTRVAAANPATVVVLNTGGPVAMPWLARVPALLQMWYPGQENGRALAAVLFGDADPSGRLPVTFPVSAGQSPATGAPRYPAGPDGYQYGERLRVGYRGFDALRRTPLFPFGFGLSYTTFGYSGLRVARVAQGGGTALRVTLTVTNTGRRPGVAVPQVYLGHPGAAGEPPWQLKGFDRVALPAGGRRTVTMTVPPAGLRIWTAARGWHTVPGDYRVAVGASSRHRALTATVAVP